MNPGIFCGRRFAGHAVAAEFVIFWLFKRVTWGFSKKGFVLLCRPLLNPYLGLVTERFEAFEALLPLSTQLILWLSDGIKKRLSSHSVPVHNAIFLAKFK